MKKTWDAVGPWLFLVAVLTFAVWVSCGIATCTERLTDDTPDNPARAWVLYQELRDQEAKRHEEAMGGK